MARPSEPGAIQALLSAFERGIAPAPASGQSWLFFNARPLGRGDGYRDWLVCEQRFRPLFNDLKSSGYSCEPSLDNEIDGADGAIVLAGRSAAANRRDFIRAWNRLRPDGTIIVVGEKKSGIASLEKWVGGQVQVDGQFAKFHSRLFQARRLGDPLSEPEAFTDIGGYAIGTGSFSADGPDPGSQLLAAHFDGRISGRIADFGAGWGYLGMELLVRAGDIIELDSYEADWISLQAARRNLRGSDIAGGFFWIDLASENTRYGYDWVIMNPPFHADRHADAELGRAFIRRASRALKPGGRLLMVANRNLPYEKTLLGEFRNFRIIGDDGGYKRIEAVR